jgi:hypothetical protein
MKHLNIRDSREVVSHCRAEITSARTRFVRQRLMLIGLHTELSEAKDKTPDDIKVLTAIELVIEKIDHILEAMVTV